MNDDKDNDDDYDDRDLNSSWAHMLNYPRNDDACDMDLNLP
jgi:hypothetical protein